MSETKSEDATASWQDWITRTTAILAVFAALSSGRWGASNLQAILEQGKVNDAWAYYQAKSIKGHGAEETRELARAIAADASKTDGAVAALAKAMDDEAAREKADKEKTYADAKALEKERDRLVQLSFWFEASFACLQLGVILCTIATGAKKRAPFYVALVFGLGGLVLTVNGFDRTHFVDAPDWLYKGTSENLAYKPEGK